MKLLILGSGGNNNYGDEALIYRFVENKHKDSVCFTFYYKKINLFNFILFPSLSLKLGFIRKIILWLFFILFFSSFDKLIIVGGGNINEFYTQFLEDLRLLIIFFKKSKKNIEFRPQSIGPFKNKLLIKKANYIISQVRSFPLREKESLKYIFPENIDRIKIQLDDGFLIPMIPLNLPNVFKNFICFNYRPFSMNLKTFLKIVEIIDFLSEKYSILFVPISYLKNNNYSDNQFKNVKFANKNNLFFLEDYFSLRSLKAGNIKYILSKSIFNIGHSFHFNVFSLSLNKFTIGIFDEEYYEIKIKGLYDMLKNNSFIDLRSNNYLINFKEKLKALNE